MKIESPSETASRLSKLINSLCEESSHHKSELLAAFHAIGKVSIRTKALAMLLIEKGVFTEKEFEQKTRLCEEELVARAVGEVDSDKVPEIRELMKQVRAEIDALDENDADVEQQYLKLRDRVEKRFAEIMNKAREEAAAQEQAQAQTQN